MAASGLPSASCECAFICNVDDVAETGFLSGVEAAIAGEGIGDGGATTGEGAGGDTTTGTGILDERFGDSERGDVAARGDTARFNLSSSVGLGILPCCLCSKAEARGIEVEGVEGLTLPL